MAQDTGNGTTSQAPEQTGTSVVRQAMPHMDETVASKVATVAVIGLGAALIEAELIPGILIGVAAMLAPNVVPKLGRGLRPFVKGAVRAGYALTEKARETMAEAGEQLQDIVAEVKSEQHQAPAVSGTEHPKPA